MRKNFEFIINKRLDGHNGACCCLWGMEESAERDESGPVRTVGHLLEGSDLEGVV